MKKRLLSLFCIGLVLFNLVACKNTTTTSNVTYTGTKKEFTKIEDLPKESTSYEYLPVDKASIKDFKDDKNYADINKLINDFSKAYAEIDYTKKQTYFDFCDFLSSSTASKLKSTKEFEENNKVIEDKKTQEDYGKTNINKIVYDSSSNSYFVDCTIYLFVKNDSSVYENNRYYQLRYYLGIQLENSKWVVDKFIGFTPLPAEEKSTTPIIYMFDQANANSVYLDDKHLNKMGDLDKAKNLIESFLKKYYTLDKNNSGNSDQLRFQKINYYVIDYDSANDTYNISLEVNYLINEKGVRAPYMFTLSRDGDDWKVDSMIDMFKNFTVSINK